MHFRFSENDQDFQLAYALRVEVFVLEQGVPREEEKDAYDATALHILAQTDGVGDVLATARLVALSPLQGKVGRVAVAKPVRGTGLGREVMLRLQERARSMGMREIVLDAQCTVIPFYEGLGYVAQGPEFLDANILHRRMTLCLV